MDFQIKLSEIYKIKTMSQLWMLDLNTTELNWCNWWLVSIFFFLYFVLQYFFFLLEIVPVVWLKKVNVGCCIIECMLLMLLILIANANASYS